MLFLLPGSEVVEELVDIASTDDFIVSSAPGGADAAALCELEPAFQAISQRQFVFDTPGQASLAKLCGNTLIATTIEALGELFSVAEKGGIANQRMLDMLSGTLFGCVCGLHMLHNCEVRI